jgi:hypothetical protein
VREGSAATMLAPENLDRLYAATGSTLVGDAEV